MESSAKRIKDFGELKQLLEIEQVNSQFVFDEDPLWDTPHADNLLKLGDVRWGDFFKIFIQDLSFGYTPNEWVKNLLLEGNIAMAQQFAIDVAGIDEYGKVYRSEVRKQEKEWLAFYNAIKEETEKYFALHKDDIQEDDIEEVRELREVAEKSLQLRSYGDAYSAYEQIKKILQDAVENKKIFVEIMIEKVQKQISQTLLELLMSTPENFPGGAKLRELTLRLLSKAQELVLAGNFAQAQQVAGWAQNLCNGRDVPLSEINRVLAVPAPVVTHPTELVLNEIPLPEHEEDISFERVWSREDDEYLINNYDVMSDSQLNLRFRTSSKDIQNRIKFHKLVLDRDTRKRLPWKNPYVAGRPIRDKRVFVGRNDIFEFIKANLQSSDEEADYRDHNLIALFGHRRTGKTSILLQLRRNRRDSLGTSIPIYVDVEGMLPFTVATSSTGNPLSRSSNFFYKLACKIRDELYDEGIEIDEPDPQSFEDSSMRFQSFLREIKKRTGNNRLVLMMDEFQALEPRFSMLDVDIFKMLRHIVQHDTNLDFILSGTLEMERIMKDYQAAMFGSAISKRIDFLDEQDARQLITAPIRKYIQYEPDAEDFIIKITASHPYFVQLVCWTLSRSLIDRGKARVFVSDVERILPQVIEHGFHFDEIWVTDTTDLELYIMSIAGELLRGEVTSSCAISEIEDKLKREGNFPKDADYFNKSLTNLINRRIMRYADSGKRVCFHVGVFGKWVYTYKPMAVVKRDIQAEAASEKKKSLNQPKYH